MAYLTDLGTVSDQKPFPIGRIDVFGQPDKSLAGPILDGGLNPIEEGSIARR
jgi:hypothetical protein